MHVGAEVELLAVSSQWRPGGAGIYNVRLPSSVNNWKDLTEITPEDEYLSAKSFLIRSLSE